MWFNPADLRGATAQHLRRLWRRDPGTRPATSTSTRRSRSGSRLRDLTKLEFRWDAFNLFNHPAFGFPNQNIGNASAGRITTTIADNRSMQFALKLNF